MPQSSETVLGFSTPRVTSLTGVPAATLSYWVSRGLITPSIRPSAGPRATRWWSLTDVIAIRVIRALRDRGCPMQSLRRAVQEVASWGVNPTDVRLCWTGADVVVVEPWGTIRSALGQPGQGILHLVVLPLLEWEQEIRVAQTERDQIDLAAVAARDMERAARRQVLRVAEVDLVVASEIAAS